MAVGEKGGLTEDRLRRSYRIKFGLRYRPEFPVKRSDQDLGLAGGLFYFLQGVDN